MSTSPPLLSFLLTSEPTFTLTRLPSLYSDLSVQHLSNPEGFHANASAWTSALTRAALASQLPNESLFVLRTSAELLDALASRQYGRPSGLGVVIDEAVREGKMCDLKGFMCEEKSIYVKRWVRVPSVGEVVRWSLRQLGVWGSDSYDQGGKLRDAEVVVVPALEDVARRVVKWQEGRAQSGSLTGRVWSRLEFVNEISTMLGLKGSGMKLKDLDVLLRHLNRDHGALSYNASTIKFKPPSSTQPPEPITKEDEAIANLHALITDLSTQTSHLETHISTLQTKAANAVKSKNKPSALAALRSKAQATKQLEQRQATLTQLEDVYAQIATAADQITIVETLQSSAGVLKSLNKKVGDVSRVEDVLDELREEMEKTSEVQQVLGESLVGDQGVVEGEVDEEFEAMEREERERGEAEEAEKTKARLAELERGAKTGGYVGEKVEGKEKEKDMANERAKKEDRGEMDVDAELARSVERMEGMSLHEKEKEKEKEKERRNEESTQLLA